MYVDSIMATLKPRKTWLEIFCLHINKLTLILGKQLDHLIVSAYRADVVLPLSRGYYQATSIFCGTTSKNIQKCVRSMLGRWKQTKDEMNHFGTVNASMCDITEHRPPGHPPANLALCKCHLGNYDISKIEICQSRVSGMQIPSLDNVR